MTADKAPVSFDTVVQMIVAARGQAGPLPRPGTLSVRQLADAFDIPLNTIAVGLAHGSQLRGADAQIIRDPGGAYPEMIVLDEDRFTDEAYHLAKAVLLKDKRLVPNVTAQRVISLLPERRLRLETAGKTQWATHSFTSCSITTTTSTAIRVRMVGAREINVEGIGSLKLVFDPASDYP
jgi:topoisomerase IA-like protein